MYLKYAPFRALVDIGALEYPKYSAVTQYADIGPESATNRPRFRPGPVPGRHPVLGGGIGGLRQSGPTRCIDPSGLAPV